MRPFPTRGTHSSKSAVSNHAAPYHFPPSTSADGIGMRLTVIVVAAAARRENESRCGDYGESSPHSVLGRLTGLPVKSSPAIIRYLSRTHGRTRDAALTKPHNAVRIAGWGLWQRWRRSAGSGANGAVMSTLPLRTIRTSCSSDRRRESRMAPLQGNSGDIFSACPNGSCP